MMTHRPARIRAAPLFFLALQLLFSSHQANALRLTAFRRRSDEKRSYEPFVDVRNPLGSSRGENYPARSAVDSESGSSDGDIELRIIEDTGAAEERQLPATAKNLILQQLGAENVGSGAPQIAFTVWRMVGEFLVECEKRAENRDSTNTGVVEQTELDEALEDLDLRMGEGSGDGDGNGSRDTIKVMRTRSIVRRQSGRTINTTDTGSSSGEETDWPACPTTPSAPGDLKVPRSELSLLKIKSSLRLLNRGLSSNVLQWSEREVGMIAQLSAKNALDTAALLNRERNMRLAHAMWRKRRVAENVRSLVRCTTVITSGAALFFMLMWTIGPLHAYSSAGLAHMRMYCQKDFCHSSPGDVHYFTQRDQPECAYAAAKQHQVSYKYSGVFLKAVANETLEVGGSNPMFSRPLQGANEFCRDHFNCYSTTDNAKQLREQWRLENEGLTRTTGFQGYTFKPNTCLSGSKYARQLGELLTEDLGYEVNFSKPSTVMEPNPNQVGKGVMDEEEGQYLVSLARGSPDEEFFGARDPCREARALAPFANQV